MREEAAERAHIAADEVPLRPDLLRLGGRWMEEVYFEFQFDENGIRRDLGAVVRTLRREFNDVEIAEWMAEPNELLDAISPLKWSAAHRDADRLADAAEDRGPAHCQD